MGAWGDGVLDNDSALDFVYVMEKATGFKNVHDPSEPHYIPQFSDKYWSSLKRRKVDQIALLKHCDDYDETLAFVYCLTKAGKKIRKEVKELYKKHFAKAMKEADCYSDCFSREKKLNELNLLVGR